MEAPIRPAAALDALSRPISPGRAELPAEEGQEGEDQAEAEEVEKDDQEKDDRPAPRHPVAL